MFSKVILATLAMALSVNAATFQVAVGGSGGNTLKFTPNTVNAKPGDMVQFNFQAANHSVVSSSANNPCTPSQNAIFSGFQPVAVGKAAPQFTVPVTGTNPMYIFCSQTKAPSHCQSGMVMIINPPNGNAINQFIQKAKTAGKSTSPKTGITGGTIKNNAAGTKPKKIVGVTSTASAQGAKNTGAAKAKAGTAGAKNGSRAVAFAA